MRKAEKKICLIMIVKNESKIILRLLRSLEKIIDYVSIVDTGSTDNTEKLILKWAKKTKIPTKVHHSPFINFAHNRTESFTKGKESFPDTDYFLLSDADHVWEVDNTFDKYWLMDEAYKVTEHSDSLEQSNIRILSSKHNWECVGVTHEHWKNDSDLYVTKLLTGIRILDHGDGGSKDDKFIRDERLLRDGLIDPTQSSLYPRYSFYLSETLRNTQQWEESIQWYKKSFDNKNWDGEIYCSHLNISKCFINLAYQAKNMGNNRESYNHLSQATVYAIRAHETDPSRIESLYYLCNSYVDFGLHEQANNILKKIYDTPEPKDKLFLEHFVYGARCRILSWLCSIKSGDVQTQRKMTKLLLDDDEQPDSIKEEVRKYSYLCNPILQR